GALIEARSCERFAALAPFVDDELGRYYRFLLKSESRHFEDYLRLAELYAGEDISERVAFFWAEEKLLVENTDTEFRFHSGVPVVAGLVDRGGAGADQPAGGGTGAQSPASGKTG